MLVQFLIVGHYLLMVMLYIQAHFSRRLHHNLCSISYFLGIMKGMDLCVSEVTFLKVVKVSAIGSANLGAISSGNTINIDYESNREVIGHYRL